MKKRAKLYVIATLGIAFLTSFGEGIAQDSSVSRASYKILPGDVLQVSVWKEPDLQLELLVRPDNAVSFPLAGEISTHNRSVSDLQAELTRRLARYIADPVVTVSVKEVLGNKVYVIGQVKEPGAFVVNPQVDVLQALAMAGGATPFADLDNIRILRRKNSIQTALSFDYKDVIRGRDLSQNVMLESGDVVVVP
ncbi:MAG: polysaccharide biosynthesis/export family protein [Gammaproteobacteria bacterium]|nr:polysaccharide biosynthesis/export family protein [Gammaproteobacteria bacterium]NNC58036.1 polysaccharide export protein [Woeseiaceae bacterium]NNL50011.1 polysaccharide export protein [Woeseiaceae bacterium]